MLIEILILSCTTLIILVGILDYHMIELIFRIVFVQIQVLGGYENLRNFFCNQRLMMNSLVATIPFVSLLDLYIIDYHMIELVSRCHLFSHFSDSFPDFPTSR